MQESEVSARPLNPNVKKTANARSSEQKFFKFCELSENRTILNPSQITVLNRLELRASTVTELNISKIPLFSLYVEKYLQHNLQYLHNLKKLVMDEISLTKVPGSIGALKKLKVLSLGFNELRNLPVTLRNCQNLRHLNVKGNRFKHCIEGIALNLKSLKTLDHERTGRPACESGYTHSVVTSEHSKRPHRLQTICAGAVFSAQTDYWNGEVIGVRQRKLLDDLANKMDLCQNCRTAILLPSKYSVETYLVKFLDSRGIARINVCSETCQEIVRADYTYKNAQNYQELIRERLVKPDATYTHSEQWSEADTMGNKILPQDSGRPSPIPEGQKNEPSLSPKNNTSPLTHRLSTSQPLINVMDNKFQLPRGISPRRRHDLSLAERMTVDWGFQAQGISEPVSGEYSLMFQAKDSAGQNIFENFWY